MISCWEDIVAKITYSFMTDKTKKKEVQNMNDNQDKEVELAVKAFTLFESGKTVNEISKLLCVPESTARYLISIVDYNTK